MPAVVFFWQGSGDFSHSLTNMHICLSLNIHVCLSVCLCFQINDSAMHHIGSNCPDLGTLNVQGCKVTSERSHDCHMWL